jgi:hypothetical protein
MLARGGRLGVGTHRRPAGRPHAAEVVGNLDNAVDTRYAAAEALGRIADPDSIPAIRNSPPTYPEVSTRRK